VDSTVCQVQVIPPVLYAVLSMPSLALAVPSAISIS
jgi:hypothetical protein